MSFPNTAYKPGDVVWILTPGPVQVEVPDNFKGKGHTKTVTIWQGSLEPRSAEVVGVLWTKDRIGYHLNDTTGDTVNLDDIFPTEAAAQKEAEKGNG